MITLKLETHCCIHYEGLWWDAWDWPSEVPCACCPSLASQPHIYPSSFCLWYPCTSPLSAGREVPVSRSCSRGEGGGSQALEQKGAFLLDSDACLFSAMLDSWPGIAPPCEQSPQHSYHGCRESSELWHLPVISFPHHSLSWLSRLFPIRHLSNVFSHLVGQASHTLSKIVWIPALGWGRLLQ